MKDADVVIVGAGAAGLSLAYRFMDGGTPRARTTAGQGTRSAPRVILMDAPKGPLRPSERTWCFWEEGAGDFDDVVVKSWERLCVRGPSGQKWESRPLPWRYKMIRSSAFEQFIHARVAVSPLFERVTAAVDSVDETPDGVLVSGTMPCGRPLRLRASWVYDSRPLSELPPARTTLLQHFRGWFVQLSPTNDVVRSFDTDSACLMDFRTRQPARGLSFGYVLPLGPDRALVEYTEFSAATLPTDSYDAALGHYMSEVLGLGSFDIYDTEQGVIPMTDARFPRRVGQRLFRIGTSGGATRPATGYTFAAVQRQSRAIADAYRSGGVPVPPRPHQRRSLAMDAVMLRALDTGRVKGVDFFTGLFEQTPMERMLRFLDGRTSIREDLALGFATPVLPMLRTVAELPLLRRSGSRH
ncbi:lycopene cyclase family protein [Streptomyces sp. NPDC058740]|uniref:lycopene cyclase family protein n=1 Tax=Streptomyces sp. NPDC058740 TaxID=3346619 RepID=UPI0036A7B7A2